MGEKKVVVRFYDDKTILLDRISLENIFTGQDNISIEYFCHNAREDCDGLYSWDRSTGRYVFIKVSCNDLIFESETIYFVFFDSLWNASGCPSMDEVIKSIVQKTEHLSTQVYVTPYTVYGDTELDECKKKLASSTSSNNNIYILEKRKLPVSDPLQVLKSIEEIIKKGVGVL